MLHNYKDVFTILTGLALDSKTCGSRRDLFWFSAVSPTIHILQKGLFFFFLICVCGLDLKLVNVHVNHPFILREFKEW